MSMTDEEWKRMTGAVTRKEDKPAPKPKPKSKPAPKKPKVRNAIRNRLNRMEKILQSGRETAPDERN